MYINPKIIVINDTNEKEDFFCSICKFCLLTAEDHELHKKYGACEECYMTFVEAKANMWNKNKKQIDKKKLSEYIYLRKKMFSKKLKLEK